MIKNTIDETNSNSPFGAGGRKHAIDISTWKRREHYQNFKNFDEPLFGIVVRVECAAAYKFAKEKGYPIARRTVAKYRQQLNIPVARLRK